MRRDRSRRSRRRRSWLRRGGELVAFVALAAVLLLTWPQSLGGRVAYVMVSGHSMEPTMHLGDLVVLRGQSDYRVGEIVGYQVPNGEVGAGATVIHRIVAGNARTGFTTRGDHNNYNDSWHPHPTNIVGTRWALIPGVAHVFSNLQGPLPLATFAALLTALATYEMLKPRAGRRRTTPARRDESFTPTTNGISAQTVERAGTLNSTPD
jgi:signal peptidase I